MPALILLALTLVGCAAPRTATKPAPTLPRNSEVWACNLVGHESDVGVGAVVIGENLEAFHFILIDVAGQPHNYDAKCFLQPLAERPQP